MQSEERVELAWGSMRALLVVQRAATKLCQHGANWSHRYKGRAAVIQSKSNGRTSRISGGER